MKFELRGICAIHRHAQYVGGQQIAGKLYPLTCEAQRRRQRVREGGFAHTWHVFDQQMPARDQARQRETNLPLFAEDDVADLRGDLVYFII